MAETAFVDVYVAAVPEANRDAYQRHVALTAQLFRDHGATRVVECWQSDVPEGAVTSFPLAVQRGEGEAVIIGTVEWSSKALRDEAMPKVMAAMQSTPGLTGAPFDGKRLIFGGFDVMLLNE